MTVQTDIDTAMASLKSAIAAYAAADGNQLVLARWLVGQLKDSDQGVARALMSAGTEFIANAPDRRSFANVG
ncbi:hypothetical protein [Bradyrhizobium sp. USDA 4473]